MKELISVRTIEVETDGELCHKDCVYYGYAYYDNIYSYCKHFKKILRRNFPIFEQHRRCADCKKATKAYKEGVR